MKSLPLRCELMCGVSCVVLDASLSVYIASKQEASPVNLLARIRIWFRLMWGGGCVGVEPVTMQPRPAVNRSKARLARRPMPLARCMDALTFIICRHHGRSHYLRWIYDYQLTWRVRWCFTLWNWSWSPRLCFVSSTDFSVIGDFCHAPLFPD